MIVRMEPSGTRRGVFCGGQGSQLVVMALLLGIATGCAGVQQTSGPASEPTMVTSWPEARTAEGSGTPDPTATLVSPQAGAVTTATPPSAAPVATAPLRAYPPTPADVLAAVQASDVDLVVEEGWDLEWDLPSRQTDWKPVGVMLHHTGTDLPGSAPSRKFLLEFDQPLTLTRYDGLQGGTRGANFLVGRDGTVYFLRATRGPHAGTGGPMTLGSDVIEADNGNGRLFGIEIESAGTSAEVHTGTTEITDGFSTAQVQATAQLTAALLTLIDRDTEHIIDHKAYAPGRKVDLVDDVVEMFREQTRAYM